MRLADGDGKLEPWQDRIVMEASIDMIVCKRVVDLIFIAGCLTNRA